MYIILSAMMSLGAIGGDMKLVNIKNGFVVIEQKDHEIIFNDSILEAQATKNYQTHIKECWQCLLKRRRFARLRCW